MLNFLLQFGGAILVAIALSIYFSPEAFPAVFSKKILIGMMSIGAIASTIGIITEKNGKILHIN